MSASAFSALGQQATSSRPECGQRGRHGQNNGEDLAQITSDRSRASPRREPLGPARLVEERLDGLEQHAAVLLHHDRVGALG